MLTKNDILAVLNNSPRPSNRYTAELRAQILSKPYFESALDLIRQNSAELGTKPTPPQSFTFFRQFMETGSRTNFAGAYTPPRTDLSVAALSAWLFENDEDLHKAEDLLWSILNEYSWTPPVHITFGGSESNKRNVSLEEIMTDGTYVIDLQSAETASTLAECALMLGDRIHPLILKRINYELERRIFTPYLTRTFIWKTKTNNWVSVCAANLGLAALAMIDDNERLAEILEGVLSDLDRYLTGFAEDGACLEGLGYWNYGFGPYVYFSNELYKRTGGAIDLLAFPITQKVAEFYSKCFFAGMRTVSFADGNSSGSFAPGLHSILLDKFPTLSIPREFVDVSLTLDSRLAFNARFFTETTERFVNSDGTHSKTHLLPKAEWYISSSENGVGIAAKGGSNNEPHNHNDVGSFQIYKNGSEIISDIGSGEYTKDYFSDKRYECFAPSSRSHSVPIIDGKYQKNGAEYKAKNTHITEKGIVLDMASAYGIDDLRSLVRSISFDSTDGSVTVRDSYELFGASHKITERLITSGTAEITHGCVAFGDEREKMYVTYDPALVSPSISVFADVHRDVPRKTTAVDFEVINPSEKFDITFVISTKGNMI